MDMGSMSRSDLGVVVVCLSILTPLGATGCSTVVSQDGPAPSAARASAPASAARIGTDPGHAGAGTPLSPRPGNQLAAFALGCFWGSENTFRHVPGVVATTVGYTGGHTTSPTYESVCTHTTGHAETVLVEFDPSRVTYGQLLAVFWKSHDPTTKDRQGPDVGDQYRSAIFTFTPAQAADARASMTDVAARFSRPITTQVQPIGAFWIAEDYHQQYDEKAGHASCPVPGAQGI
jgi:peptide-methionine (S)-S-oxide reductase